MQQVSQLAYLSFLHSGRWATPVEKAILAPNVAQVLDLPQAQHITTTQLFEVLMQYMAPVYEAGVAKMLR